MFNSLTIGKNMRFLILIILSSLAILPLAKSAQAQEATVKREQNLDETLTLTLYGNRYIVATFVLPDTSLMWHQIHQYVPSEILKLDNPTLAPEKLKIRLYRMKKPSLNEYTFLMDDLAGKIANKYPQHVAPNLQLQIAEFLTSNRAEHLAQLFPEFREEIMNADVANKKIAAFMFLEEIVDYNIGLWKKAEETQKKIDAEKAQKESETKESPE